MNLHTNNQLFQDAVTAAAQKFNIPEIYIEKDYWVTVALHAIFHGEPKEYAVFKGGTSLSKCYKLIDRFSEDVDMVIFNKGESANQLKNKLKTISEAVNEIMPEVEIPGITAKKGMNRKTAHQYSKGNFGGTFGQVREQIIVEATWLGSSEPYTEAEVGCYITEMMQQAGQDELIKTYNLQPFNVKVLSKERTFCEKIMSLVRFSRMEEPHANLANKIRHIYDLHMMLKDQSIKDFFQSTDFDILLNQVGKDDVISYKNNNEWLQHHPKDAIIFNQPAETWSEIRHAYKSFGDLVLGELPSEEELLSTLKLINNRLEKIDWKVK